MKIGKNKLAGGPLVLSGLAARALATAFLLFLLTGCVGSESRSGRSRAETCSAVNRECFRSCREHRGGFSEKRRPDVPYTRSTRLNQCENRCRNQLEACRKRDA